MKKLWPYIITFGVLALIALVIVGASRRMPHRMDERITLKEKDKIPYGTAAARNFCEALFPNTSFASDGKSPGHWETIKNSSGKQAVIMMAGYFNADEYELKQVMKFVEKGNYVFIIANTFSTDVQSAFAFNNSQDNISTLFGVSRDSLRVRLEPPAFDTDSFYLYPGKRFESWFDTIDSSHAVVLGSNGTKPNFIRMDYGEGSVFIHTAPLAFSNYFILHKNNIRYFEQVMSVLPSDLQRVVWNDYYLSKKINNKDKREPNWLGVLLRYPEFKWGLLTVLFGVLLFVLLGSRRKQRMIPAHTRPKNDSLDFVKTMGRLYYDRRDHQNLARKMGMYFLEHVRSAYKLPTHTLDEAFIEGLQFKSGHSRGDLNEIISFIQYLHNHGSVNENQLIIFHNQLEAFYQNT